MFSVLMEKLNRIQEEFTLEKIENKLIVLAFMLVVALLGLSGCQNNNNTTNNYLNKNKKIGT